MQSSVKAPDPALRRTRGYAPPESDAAGGSLTAVDAVGETMISGKGPAVPATAVTTTISASRTTVLPRRRLAESGASIETEQRPRFETVGLLGRGGMGEVSLVKDHDIRRTVAVKRLSASHRHGEAVLRFADEVRAVGQLEHPGIVPVYDVGVDDDGQHYLVMKHVQGETLERVIERLRAGDPRYTERFTFEYRAHVFLEVLQAIRYAHDRGILHRDLKPANIMIGAFGEVTVMDWGLAKQIEPPAGPARQSVEVAETASVHTKVLETVAGALIGTPLYMSPEQAAGKNEELDPRSDVFSLCLLFFEMLALKHPLHGIDTVQEVLASLIAKDLDQNTLGDLVFESRMPIEYFQFLVRGLPRDREKRFQSVAEMENGLRAILSGDIPANCHISFVKRSTHKFLHWVDRHPMLFTALMGATLVAAIGALGWGALRLVRAIAGWSQAAN